MHSRGADRRRANPGPLPPELGLTGDRRRSNDRRSNGFISSLQLFASIPYQAIEAVLADCAITNVAAGEVLLEPGQRNEAIHLLIDGRLRIHFDHRESPDFIPIEAGGCFGELSIIDGLPVSAYVVADRASRVLCIDQQLFWNQLIPQPGVARNLLATLSERMRLNRDIIMERMKDSLELEHLQKELSIAHDIQLSMLPDRARMFGSHANVDAWATMQPAKNVGGDFYDAFYVTPERLFVAIGDVSGKGVPAALFMARAMTQLRTEALHAASPSDILEAANRALSAGNESSMFVTLFCGVLDLGTGGFSYANAGHNPPVLLDADTGSRFLEVSKGIVAGIMDAARYPLGHIQLDPRKTILLYTDGVTEAMNTEGAFYTDERLLEATGSSASASARELVNQVHDSVIRFAGDAPQADDITLLALRWHPRQPQT